MLDQNSITLNWVFEVIRRWWWLIIGLGLLAIGAAWTVTSMTPPVYEASTTLLANPSKNSNASQYTDLMAGQQLALTYSQMIKDRPVLEATIAKLGLKKTPGELEKNITADVIRDTQIIQLTVMDSNPAQAALIANTLAKAFTERVEQLSSDRYAGTIQNAKNRVDDLQTQLINQQNEVDSLRAQRVAKNISLANKQSSLIILQNDYRSFQDSYQNMQLAVAQITGKVYIVDPVQLHPSIYSNASSATAVVSVGQQTTGSGSLTNDRLALTYGKLMVKPPLLEGIIKELGLSETSDQLAKKIRIELVTGTQLVRLTVDDSDGPKAELIAQSLVNAFITQFKALLAEPYSDQLDNVQKQISDTVSAINTTQADVAQLSTEVAQLDADIDRLDTNISEIRSDFRAAQQSYEQAQSTAAEATDSVVVTEPALTPKHPTQNRLLYISVAGLVGLMIGAGLAFLLMFIEDKIQNSQDVRNLLNLPILSTIGRLGGRKNDLVMDDAPGSEVAEDFRMLGNKIRLMKENTAIRTILVTSPAPSEGKSVIVSNLAIGLSRMGLRVVVVDADLRLPRIHRLFNLSQKEGLTNSLEKGQVNGTMQPTEVGDLKIITSGDIPSNPAEVLSSTNLMKLLEELKEKADLVLIDCPPILAAADASILASKVDSVLLVLRAGKSQGKAAREAMESLHQVKANVIGVVLNAVPERKEGYYKYYRKAESRLK